MTECERTGGISGACTNENPAVKFSRPAFKSNDKIPTASPSSTTAANGDGGCDSNRARGLAHAAVRLEVLKINLNERGNRL